MLTILNTSHSVGNTTLQNASAGAISRVVMNDTELAIRLISEVSFAEELIAKLKEFPGALERIIRSDDSPRWVKRLAEETLEEAGYVILS